MLTSRNNRMAEADQCFVVRGARARGLRASTAASVTAGRHRNPSGLVTAINGAFAWRPGAWCSLAGRVTTPRLVIVTVAFISADSQKSSKAGVGERCPGAVNGTKRKRAVQDGDGRHA